MLNSASGRTRIVPLHVPHRPNPKESLPDVVLGFEPQYAACVHVDFKSPRGSLGQGGYNAETRTAPQIAR